MQNIFARASAERDILWWIYIGFNKYINSTILPYGIYWDRDTIEEECQPGASGETCAAKIMLDGWVMKKGGQTPYFIYKKTLNK